MAAQAARHGEDKGWVSRTGAAEGNESTSGVSGASATLNVAVRKKFLSGESLCGRRVSGFDQGLFRPHYVTWSEQQLIEFHAPEYLRNVVRIITETGLRVYMELMSMKKDQVDLENALV